MTCSKFSAQNKVTPPFLGWSLEELSSLGQKKNVSGVFTGGNWESLDLRRVGHQGQNVDLFLFFSFSRGWGRGPV